MIKIVKPTIEQLDELMKLWVQQGDYHYSLDSQYYKPSSDDEIFMKNAIEKDSPNILVAEIDEEIAGFGTFIIGKSDYGDTKIDEFGEVQELFVSPKFRGKGVGKALMEAIEKFFKSKNLKWIKLYCSSYNSGALDFYEKIDYIDRQRLLFKEIS